MADTTLNIIDEAFDDYWNRLGRNMPRTNRKETDEQYRERTARCAFGIAMACFLISDDDDK